MDGEEIGIIGLVSRIGRDAELLGRQGMNVPGFEPGRCEGVFDGKVINASLLDANDQIAEVMRHDRSLQARDRFLEALPRMFDRCGRDEDATVEIGEDPFGSSLGTIDGDDAECSGVAAWTLG